MAKFSRISGMTKGLMNLTGNVAKVGVGAAKVSGKGSVGKAGGFAGDLTMKLGKSSQGFYAKKMKGR